MQAGIGDCWDSDQERGAKAPTSRQGKGCVWAPEGLGLGMPHLEPPAASEAPGQLGSPCSLPEPRVAPLPPNCRGVSRVFSPNAAWLLLEKSCNQRASRSRLDPHGCCAGATDGSREVAPPAAWVMGVPRRCLQTAPVGPSGHRALECADECIRPWREWACSLVLDVGWRALQAGGGQLAPGALSSSWHEAAGRSPALSEVKARWRLSPQETQGGDHTAL